MKFLIVGLGNVGHEYPHTRHNIGFDVVMAFVQKHGGMLQTDRLAYKAEVKWKGKIFVCICPTTYMNLSGKAVNYWMHELRIPLENMLVVVDELALPFGKIRLKPKGSSGGHNGLKSIEALCGGQSYPRLRFGIGDNFPKGRQVDYVLSSFDEDEEAALPALIDTSIQMIESFVHIGIELTMTNFNK